jgi:hypothetical protein
MNETDKYEHATYFLNENTRVFLNYQKFEEYRDIHRMSFSRMMFLTLKQWIYTKIHRFMHRSIMFFSSIILYYLGLRPVNDIDIMISEHIDQRMMPRIERDLMNRETSFSHLDVSKRGMGEWTPDSYKESWLIREWPQLFGARDLDDVVYNPRYHGFIMGMKTVSLQADVERRIHRSRASATADLYVLKTQWMYPMRDIEMPKMCWKDNVEVEYTKQETIQFLKTVCKYLRDNYEIRISFPEVCEFLHMEVPEMDATPHQRGPHISRGTSYMKRGGRGRGKK